MNRNNPEVGDIYRRGKDNALVEVIEITYDRPRLVAIRKVGDKRTIRVDYQNFCTAQPSRGYTLHRSPRASMDAEQWVAEAYKFLCEFQGDPKNETEAKNMRQWAESMCFDDCSYYKDGYEPKEAVQSELTQF